MIWKIYAAALVCAVVAVTGALIVSTPSPQQDVVVGSHASLRW